MKNKLNRSTLFIISLMILFSCQTFNKENAIEELTSLSNNYEIEKIKEKLSDDFIYYQHNKKYSKQEYLDIIDSLKRYETTSKILTLENQDSLIVTEEELMNMVDSFLEVSPRIKYRRTYRFVDNKIQSITRDTVLNFEKYLESLTEKIVPFSTYTKYELNIKNEKDIFDDLKNYLLKYSSLSNEEKNKYKIIGNLQGVYTCEKCIYAKVEFKGMSTVVIYDGFLGIPFPTSYVMDQEYIRVKTDKSDLLFKIEGNDKLIGEGWAKGEYIKVK